MNRPRLLTALLPLMVILILAAAFFTGWALRGGDSRTASSSTSTTTAGTDTLYTCSMHPQIKLPDPEAKCPLCGMDLIPATTSSDSDEVRLALSPEAVALAGIEVTPVRRGRPALDLRIVGTLHYDETTKAVISAYIAGRMERVYVDYTGIAVRKGDHLVDIYSPELLTAEAELVSVLNSVKRLRDTGNASSAGALLATLEASREKLLLWGLTQEQVDEVERTGESSDHVTLFSPMAGIVTTKHVVEGQYVRTGEPIFSIANLDRLWLQLQAYESDLPWLRYGQPVTFTTEAVPGVHFHGAISFISPSLDHGTRTAQVRINVDNRDRRLRPGMIAHAVVRPQIGPGGVVLGESLAGRYVCPMHPEAVGAGPEPCPICGMDLVPAEEVDPGLVHRTPTGPMPLVIPASAPLITGSRAIVYVQIPDMEMPTFESRTVTLGPRAGGLYIVHESDAADDAAPPLREGELVVTRGNFKIDSALQLQGSPSQMSQMSTSRAKEPAPPRTDLLIPPPAFSEALDGLFSAYVREQAALAGDDLDAFRTASAEFIDAADSASAHAGQLAPEVAVLWAAVDDAVALTEKAVSPSTSIEDARRVFRMQSETLIELGDHVAFESPAPLRVVYCPMAFGNTGAFWVQTEDTVANPYFGASMLRCGAFKQTLGSAAPGSTSRPERSGERATP